ncbi:MAG: T9SS type A sorting domain-containing protein [bacterium]
MIKLWCPKITFANLTDQCKIRIYNIARELVFDQEFTNTNGKVELDLKNKQGKPVVSGVYIYKLTLEDAIQIDKDVKRGLLKMSNLQIPMPIR